MEKFNKIYEEFINEKKKIKVGSRVINTRNGAKATVEDLGSDGVGPTANIKYDKDPDGKGEYESDIPVEELKLIK